jgi:hypothetical protein
LQFLAWTVGLLLLLRIIGSSQGKWSNNTRLGPGGVTKRKPQTCIRDPNPHEVTRISGWIY